MSGKSVVMHSRSSIDGALADLAWLRRFALRLVRDGDEAEDLVQETLVEATATGDARVSGDQVGTDADAKHDRLEILGIVVEQLQRLPLLDPQILVRRFLKPKGRLTLLLPRNDCRECAKLDSSRPCTPTQGT